MASDVTFVGAILGCMIGIEDAAAVVSDVGVAELQAANTNRRQLRAIAVFM